MRYLFIFFICSISLISVGQSGTGDFETEKTKVIDSLNLVYASAIKKAQQDFENALLKADESLQKALADLEKKEIEWLKSVAIKPEEVKVKNEK